jgi:hypothetical protein
LRSKSSTASTLQVCKFDEVEADCAAATSWCNVPGGSGAGEKARTERCDRIVVNTSFHRPVAAMPWR